MERKTTFVRDLDPGQKANDIYMLAEARQGQAKNGPFWALTLADRSGEVPAKIFSPQAQAYPRLESGMFVRAIGTVGTYRDQAQIVVDELTILDMEADGLHLADFVPASERPAEDMLADLEALCKEHLKHKPLRALCRKVLTNKGIKSRLMTAPGAISVHHAYAGGLLEHTLAVCRACMAFCDLYPHLDRQVLLVAAIFHDLGKAWEYADGPVREHTDEGRLLGHIHLGMAVLEPFFAKAVDLEQELEMHIKHLILAHHGELEWGSPKRPKTPEAFALHFADNLDAKIKTVAEAVEDVPENEQGWSPYVRPLSRFVYRPMRTPDPADQLKEKGPIEQCSLLSKG